VGSANDSDKQKWDGTINLLWWRFQAFFAGCYRQQRLRSGNLKFLRFSSRQIPFQGTDAQQHLFAGFVLQPRNKSKIQQKHVERH